jgi:hypothetical protein
MQGNCAPSPLAEIVFLGNPIFHACMALENVKLTNVQTQNQQELRMICQPLRPSRRLRERCAAIKSSACPPADFECENW